MVKKYSLLFLFLLFILSSCGKVTVHNQIQQLEKLATSSRKQVEKEILDDEKLISKYGIKTSFWELCPYQYYSEEIYHYVSQSYPEFAQDCKDAKTSEISLDKDIFLDFYIASDYFGQKNNENDPYWYYPPTRIDLCSRVKAVNSPETGYEYELLFQLTYFSDARQNITDNLFHYIGRMSIPFMIKMGLISQNQQDLCIYNFDSDGGSFTERNNYTFNLLRVDKSQIEQIMQELENKGIVYQYPQ